MLPMNNLPMSSTDRLRSELIFKSRSGQLSARFVVIPESRLMEHLPRHLGEGRALDDAVRLICSPSGHPQTVQAYGLALRSLRDSIAHGSISTEALGAATLLQMHELSQGPQDSASWVVHAKGVVNMLTARGPHAVKTGFDRCLLQAQVGNITFDALRERRECFLARPEWNKSVKSFGVGDVGKRAGNDQVMSLIAIGVGLPGLVCRFEDFETARNGDSFKFGQIDTRLAEELLTMRGDILTTLKQIGGKSRSADHLPSENDRTNRIRPALLLSANVYLILIDYMLDSIRGGPDPQTAVPESIAITMGGHDNILRSIENHSQRLRTIDAMAYRSTSEMMRFTMDRVRGAAEKAKKDEQESGAMGAVYRILTGADENLIQAD